MIRLADTMSPMLSSDYRVRYAAEYWQLRIRWQKLCNLINDWDAGKLGFEPTCPRTLLDAQALYMRRYMRALEERAEIEGIDLCDLYGAGSLFGLTFNCGTCAKFVRTHGGCGLGYCNAYDVRTHEELTVMDCSEYDREDIGCDGKVQD